MLQAEQYLVSTHACQKMLIKGCWCLFADAAAEQNVLQYHLHAVKLVLCCLLWLHVLWVDTVNTDIVLLQLQMSCLMIHWSSPLLCNVLKDTIEFQADDALTQHQKDQYRHQAGAGQLTKLTQLQKRAHQSQQEQHSQQQQRLIRDRKQDSNAGHSPGRLYNKQPSKQVTGRPDASPKKRPADRARIWMC